MLDHLFINVPTFETERLIIRKLEYSDKKDIFSYACNPEVAKHVLWYEHHSEIDTLEFLNFVYEGYNKNTSASWGILLKNTNTIIGTAGFVSWNRKKKEAEIGYVISEKYWGKGITTEVVNVLLNFGFKKMGLGKISARCKPENIGSVKVLEKCGFTFDGIIKNHIMIKEKLHDMKTFSYLAENFGNQKNEQKK